MIKIDIRSDTREITDFIKMEKSKIARAQVRAINRTAENLRTEAGRKIREEYNVTLRGIRQAAKILRAHSGSRFPFAELTFSGRPINLIEFGATAVNPWNVKGRKHTRKGGGVSVQIKVKSGRKLIPGAFLGTIRSGQNVGKKGVFRRSGPEHWAPIKFLPSISIPQMVSRRAINAALVRFAGQRYRVNLRAALNSFGGDGG